jgi:hypothetical protein
VCVWSLVVFVMREKSAREEEGFYISVFSFREQAEYNSKYLLLPLLSGFYPKPGGIASGIGGLRTLRKTSSVEAACSVLGYTHEAVIWLPIGQ